MPMDDFALCFAERVGTTVDGVIALTSALGEDGIRAVRDTWNSLPPADQKVITWLAGVSTAALKKILEKLFGIALAEALIVFVGFFSWGILIGSLIACADSHL